MKIAVMGAGALGGYFGGRLAAAGHEVVLIARGAHLAAIRERGLKIQSPRGDLHLAGIAATDDPSIVRPVDVVMFMVKNYDVESGARAIAPMLGPETMVITAGTRSAPVTALVRSSARSMWCRAQRALRLTSPSPALSTIRHCGTRFHSESWMAG